MIQSETILKSASVKVMQSYNYCHFEASMMLENEQGVTVQEIDNARKACQRLTDKAVKQYQVAKECAAKRIDGEYKMRSYEEECLRIAAKDEQDRTIKEIAMLKQFHDENWRAQFEYEYDYDDDSNYNL